MKPNRQQAARLRRITAALGDTGLALPGSLSVRSSKCGKANCRCKAEPPQLHGPYAVWTWKENAKTVGRRLTTDEVAEYQPLFDNARKLRALLDELHDLTLEIIDTDRPVPRTTQNKAR